jgi:HIP---CoA ligase
VDRFVETIPSLLARAAAAFGSRPAVIGPGMSVSYDELMHRVLKAGALLATSGVTKGDRVAIWLPNGSEFIEAALATAFVGACVVPLNTRLKGREAAYILRKARPTVLISVGEFLGVNYADALANEDFPSIRKRFRVGPGDSRWAEWSGAVSSVDDSALAKISQVAASVGPDDIAEVMYTSGTTGFPKGAMLRHSQIVRAYGLWAERIGIHAGDRYLIIAPMFHSYGFKAGVLACIAAGAAMYPVATFDAAEAIEIIETQRITVTGGPPTIFISLLAKNEDLKRDISSLRSVSTGGSMVPPAMIRALQAIGVKSILNAYGLTEATALVTMTSADDEPETIAATSGRPIHGVEVRCAKSDDTPCSLGEAGEIQVKGFDVMAGYFEDPVATQQAFTADGWLKTGDIGVIDERSNLRVTDRLKDMFIVGGFNCYPAEIERILLECPGVAQVAVVGVPDERMGEVGKAFVVPKIRADFSAEPFLAWCRQNMANYKVPRHVEVVDVIPRNAMGKIQKFLLRDHAASA